MFQSFDAATTPEQGPPRLAALRAEMAEAGFDALLVPRADAHQGEYVAARDERLAWLTGFTGSAGFCIVLTDGVALFTDGRYTLQACAQTAPEFEIVPWPATQPGDWLSQRLPEGAVLGFDPWLHTAAEIDRLRAAAPGLVLEPGENLIDRIWTDQPPAPSAPLRIYPQELAGAPHADKRARLAQTLRDEGQRAAVLTLPDSIAWLLNIRGADIPRIPVALAFAILHDDARVDLFLDPRQSDAITDHLGPDITIGAQNALLPTLAALAGPVRLDGATAPLALRTTLTEAGIEVVDAPDPCQLPKACKTAAEIENTAEAHLRDGAAFAAFLAWLDAEAPGGTLTEIDVVERLEAFRRATNALKDISFETICGAGPNGAIVHYRVSRDTNRPVRAGELLLVDSGGQYLDGTTDITRTVAIGDPDAEQRACFTRVLRGMIGIARLRFPKGLAGRDIDAIARAPLWMAHQDYDHGTGHGVGVYLSVHEGPQRISRASDVPLQPGMILSDEPGYYREGAFGIRIENLLAVEPAPVPSGGDAQREMLRFRTLTFAPIDRRLIDLDQLSGEERAWIDAYHAEVLDKVGPRVAPDVRSWLEAATAPL